MSGGIELLGRAVFGLVDLHSPLGAGRARQQDEQTKESTDGKPNARVGLPKSTTARPDQLHVASELTQLVSNATPFVSTSADPIGGIPLASR